MSTEAVFSLAAARCIFGFGAAKPATSPPAIPPATSTAPSETYQRIAALPSYRAMVTRKPAFEKQEHGLVLHIQVNPTALISPRLPLRRSMRISFRLALGRRTPVLQAFGHRLLIPIRNMTPLGSRAPIACGYHAGLKEADLVDIIAYLRAVPPLQ